MDELESLLDSVSTTISTYRTDDLPVPNPEHVQRWLEQFRKENHLPFLREFDHVLKQSFFSKSRINSFLISLTKNEKLAGNAPKDYWSNANFLNIQENGQSQKEMLSLFGDCLQNSYGLNLAKCGMPDGDYIYLDDVMFTGGRVGHDLARWIHEDAPQSANVQVIVAALHTSGHFLTERTLQKAIQESGKHIEIHYWRSIEIENRKYYKNSSNILWPTSIPDVKEVTDYMELPSKFPFEPRLPPTNVPPFSSEEARQVLEAEFLIAGAKIIARIEDLKPSIRPLGFSPFGIGFGAMIVTYRNCPNNCPLSMWWGDPLAKSGALHWYPLLQREGYSSPRNVFKSILDMDI